MFAPAALAQDDNGLQILGLHIGQADAGISDILFENGFTPKLQTQNTRRKAGSDRFPDQQFETPRGDRLSLKLGAPEDKTGPARIVSIHYAPMGRDAGLALEKRLRGQFGAPAARYAMENESHLYVWERPAPVQSREFGPLMSVSLKTGETPKLSMSQFSRPAAFATSSAEAAPKRAAPAKRARSTSRAPSLRSGPVN